jgi:uncharacterized membrane protein
MINGPLEPEQLSPSRRTFDQFFLPLVEGFVVFVARHWLAMVNLALGVLSGLPFLSPILEASSNPSVSFLGQIIFVAYKATCHQLPYRSFFILGHQMAWCERDTAIWGTLLLAGILFSFVRRRLPPLPFQWFVVLCIPMAIDGFTQLFGWRESTWELRLITGAIFGLATAWLIFPVLEKGMREVRESVESKTPVSANP